MAYSSQTHDVHERQTGRVRFTLKDQDGAPVAGAAFSAATLTLYDTRTLTVLPSRPANQNVLNTNNVSVHASSGEWTWEMQPNDNAIVGPVWVWEQHVALFQLYWGGKEFRHEVILNVRNLHFVP